MPRLVQCTSCTRVQDELPAVQNWCNHCGRAVEPVPGQNETKTIMQAIGAEIPHILRAADMAADAIILMWIGQHL